MKLLNLLLFTTFSVLPPLDAAAPITPEDAPTATNFVETGAINIPNPSGADDGSKISLSNGCKGTLPQHTNSLDLEHPTALEIPTNVQSHSITKAVIEQMDDWINLKKTTAYCAILWGWALYSYYSQYFGIAEMWQSKGPRNSAATGYPDVSVYCFIGVRAQTVRTINLSLKYFKLDWLTPELTISSISPYVVLFVFTTLSIVVNEYNLHCIIPVVHSIAVGLWYSLYDDYQKQTEKRTLTPHS